MGDRLLTSDPPLATQRNVWGGGVDFSEIIARGYKNKHRWGLFEIFAKSIGENRNRLAIVVWEI